MQSVHDFTARANDGSEIPLSRYRGQVLLIVNTASRCGFTPQYEGLEGLYREFGSRGFSVLAFPCNQFANQEKGSDTEIASFCSTNYDVSFPIFAKIEVNGRGADPLWQFLKDEKKGLLGGAVKWNFTKFLVGRGGDVVARYGPTTTPAKIAGPVAALLAATGT